MHQNPTDRLVAGVLLGGLVTAVIVAALIWLGIPQHASVLVRLALPVGIAAAVLFPAPLLKRTVLRH